MKEHIEPGAQAQKLDHLDKSNPSFLDSLLAGVVRSISYALKHAGLSGRFVGAALRKRAFLTIGSRTRIHHRIEGHAILDSGVQKSKSPARASTSAVALKRVLGLVKGALLGFSAFGIYDILILQDWFFPRPPRKSSHDVLDNVTELPIPLRNRGDILESHALFPTAPGRAPLIAHFVAGSLAGLSQSLVMDTWEVVAYWWTHRRTESFVDHWKHGVNKRFIIRRLVHHSVGFATLFGTYESMRRWILYQSLNFSLSDSTCTVMESFILVAQHNGLLGRSNSLVHQAAFVPVASSFLAGGIAGQAHYVVSHYSSHWKLHATKRKTHRMFPKPPTARAVLGGFLPTAVSFVAFQYGGELIARFLEEYES